MLGLAVWLAPLVCQGADEVGTPATPPAAVVVIFNRPVAVFRAANFGFNPKERAAYVEKRITELMAQHPEGEVATRASTEGTAVTIGGELAFNITPADVDAIGGQTQEQAAEFAVKELRTVMGDMQKQHSWPFLIKSLLFCLAATVVFAGVIWLVRRAEHWATPRLTVFFGRMSDRLTKGGFFILAQVAYFVRWTVRIVGWTLVLTGAYTWAAYCLAQFPYTEPWAGNLGGFVTGTFAGFLRSCVNTLPDLFVVVIIAAFAAFLGRLVRGFFQAIQNGQIIFGSLDAQAAKATGRIAVVVIWLFAVVMMYPYLPGSGSQAFRGVSVFVGLLISIGASGVVGQFMGGLVLMYSKALKSGEYVRVGEQEGTVLSVGFLSTKILTPWNEEIHLPNLLLLNTSLKNYSRLSDTEGVILYTTVTIGYGTPWRQVQALLVEAAGRTPGLRRTPAPHVTQRALADFYVEYQVNATLDEPRDRIPTLSALHANILDLFNEYGVQILSPHYRQDPAEKVFVPKDRWFEAPAVRPGGAGASRGGASGPPQEKL